MFNYSSNKIKNQQNVIIKFKNKCKKTSPKTILILQQKKKKNNNNFKKLKKNKLKNIYLYVCRTFFFSHTYVYV